MINHLSEIICAVRIAFSKEKRLSAKVFPEKIVEKINKEEDFQKLGYASEGQNVLVISKMANSKSGLLKLINEWKENKSYYPNFVFVEGMGAFVLADNAAVANKMILKRRITTINTFGKRLAARVAVVTGGAQGFGEGIAICLFNEGANVVIADLNTEAGKNLVKKLNSKKTSNQALFVQTDVSKPLSVEQLINKTVLNFGGLDIMISNAGILRAGGLDEMTPETFELMTKVNYSGYFNCAKYASAIMKIQSEFNNSAFYDIIQVNSKSGLKGSNKNFAYAGGKFGSIGLTQSFAMELMPNKIKVNSICPGNFFDGPLWSHPETGLFSQYLNAGKVSGAKTLEDVKKFYEQQVPAGRGCEVKDVAKAILYAIDQEYETGQAIPVTGGQIMLH